MKKLYRKSTVHPTPSVVSEQLLSFLPAAILTLTAALSTGDREVLAYLISCSSAASFSNSHRKTTPKTTVSGGGDHSPSFNCNCFRCYMSYWVKWDSSPNRQLIHEIIDAFEDSLLKESKREKNRRERRKGKSVKGNVTSLGLDETKNTDMSLTKEDFHFVESTTAADGGGGDLTGGGSGGDEEDNAEEEELEKGSVRRIVSFLGERIWSVWG